MTTAPPSLPEVGDLIDGKYRVLRRMADGGMGVVYEAVHERLGQRVALKMIYPHYGREPEFARRFEREGRIAARLQGPNTARIHDIDAMPNGVRYMVMELLHGHDAEHLLKSSVPIPIGVAVDIVYQTAVAMAEAHSLGVVHRDLKPGNLFLCDVPGTDRKLVKVLDFGISRFVQEDAHKLTEDLATLGTPFYMAPEQVRGAAGVDARSDVWALGVILYELLTRRLPFEGKVTEVLVKVATDPVVAPSRLRADIPFEVEAIVLRALAKSREERFQSMNELCAALAPLAPEETVEALASRVPREAPLTGGALTFTRSSYPSMTTMVEPAAPRRRVALGAFVAVGALAGAGAIFASTQRGSAIVPAQATAPSMAQQAPPAVDEDVELEEEADASTTASSVTGGGAKTPGTKTDVRNHRPKRTKHARPPVTAWPGGSEPPAAPEPTVPAGPAPAPAAPPPGPVENPRRL